MTLWKVGDIIFEPLNIEHFRYIYHMELYSCAYLYPHWEYLNNRYVNNINVFELNLIYTDLFRELGQ